MNQTKLSPEQNKQEKESGFYDKTFKYRQETFGGFHFDFLEQDGNDHTPEQRREHFDRIWKDGGFRFWLATYKDLLFSKETNDEAYKFWAEKTRARINDPRKKDILAPVLEKQHHT